MQFYFPQRPYTVQKNGDPQSHTVRVLVQYRNAVTAGAWAERAYNFTNKTADSHGYTRRISGLAAAQYEVRVCRTTKIGGARTVNNVY